MKFRAFVLILGFLHCISSNAQQDKYISVSVQISFDTVELEEPFEVKYTLKNSKMLSRFETPTFKDFNFISGPMTSQTTSIINGEISQSVTYTFILTGNHWGTYKIPSVGIETLQGTLITDELEITIVDKLKSPREQNSSNAFQLPFQGNSFFNGPFFNQRLNPGQSMDNMYKEFDKLFNIEPLFEDKIEINPKKPNQSPSEIRNKKKEKIYKI